MVLPIYMRSQHMTAPQPSPEMTADFMRLYAECARTVYWVICAAVARADDADEVFQETSATLWRKFGEFEPGSNFAAWAAQIARFEVRRFYKRQAREGKLFRREDVVEKMLARTEQILPSLGHRFEFLRDCLAELPFPDRDLVRRRYEPGMSSKKLAGQLQRSESYVSKSLARIHRLLFECIERHEADGEEGK